MEATIAKVVEDFGKIDVFVANAGKLDLLFGANPRLNELLGMAISKPILEQTLPEFDKQMSVNGTLN